MIKSLYNGLSVVKQSSQYNTLFTLQWAAKGTSWATDKSITVANASVWLRLSPKQHV